MRNAVNIISTAGTGTTVIDANRDRSYFFVVATDAAATVRFGADGTGDIPLAVGSHYEPYVCPTGEITITSTGNYIYVMG